MPVAPVTHTSPKREPFVKVTAMKSEPGLLFVASFPPAIPVAAFTFVPAGQAAGLNVLGATVTTSRAAAYVHVQVLAATPWLLVDPAVPNSGVSEEAPNAVFTAPGETAAQGSGEPCRAAVAGATRSRTRPASAASVGASRRSRGVGANVIGRGSVAGGQNVRMIST